MNILFLSLRPYYDVLERSLVRDANCLRDGNNLYFYCLRDSYLDEKLKQNFTNILYYPGGWSERRRKRFDISPFVNKYDIDLVLCYDLGALSAAVQSLKNDLKTSLVLIVGKPISTELNSYAIHKLMQRVDRVYLTTSLLSTSVMNNLGVSRHKICDLGIGVSYVTPLWEPRRETFFQKYGIFEEVFAIGIYVPTELKRVEDFRPLVAYLRHAKIRFGQSVRFILYSPLTWSIGPLYKELAAYFEEEEVIEVVSFAHTTVFHEMVNHVDLWLSAFKDGNLMDSYILAFAVGTPVIWIRDSYAETVLERYPGMGKTFKEFNARELGDHIEYFLHHGPPGDEIYFQAVYRLVEEDNAIRHRQLLVENASLLIARRRRYHLRQKRRSLFALFKHYIFN